MDAESSRIHEVVASLEFLMVGEYSPDESFAAVAAAAIALFIWIRWYYAALNTFRLCTAFDKRWILLGTPVLCLLILYLVLRTLASADVQNASEYLFFYMVLGSAWLALFQSILPWLGLSARDDVFERSNRASVWANSGALIAGNLCFCGGNVGNGPGWWTVLFSAALAAAVFLYLTVLIHLGANSIEKISIERDEGAGLRALGFFISSGIILGGAVAGDWISASATLRDFIRAAWPAAGLTVVAVILERSYRPVHSYDFKGLLTYGWLPTLAYLGIAFVTLAVLHK